MVNAAALVIERRETIAEIFMMVMTSLDGERRAGWWKCVQVVHTATTTVVSTITTYRRGGSRHQTSVKMLSHQKDVLVWCLVVSSFWVTQVGLGL
jgi:hypothetical protein